MDLATAPETNRLNETRPAERDNLTSDATSELHQTFRKGVVGKRLA